MEHVHLLLLRNETAMINFYRGATNMSNKEQSFLHDLVYYAITYIVPMIVGFMLVPIFTSNFTTAEYGQYSLINASVGLLGIISVNWINVAFIRYYTNDENDPKEKQLITVSIVALTAIISIIAILLYIMSALGVVNRIIPSEYLWLTIVLLFSANLHSFFFSYLRANRKARFATILTTITILIRFGTFLFLLNYFNLSIGAILLATIISDVIYTVIVLLKEKKHMRIIKITSVDLAYVKEYFLYGLPFILILGVHWLLTLSDRYMLEFLRDSSEVGIYSINYSFAQQIMMPLITIFMSTAEPILFRKHRTGTTSEVNQVLNNIFKYFFMLILPAVIGLSVVSNHITSLFIKNDFQEGFVIIPIVSFGFLFLGIRQYLNKSLELVKKSKEIANISLVAAGTNIVLNLIFIPLYGYMGAACATLIAYFVYFALSYYKTNHLTDLRIKFSGDHIKIILSSSIMGVGVFSGNYLPIENVPFLLAIQISIGVFLYLISLLMMGVITEEKNKLIGRLKRKGS